MKRRTAALALLVALAGCAAGDPPAAVPAPTASPVGDPALRDELLAMLREDQAERTGASTGNGDEARARRLAAILDQHGWPGFDLVGKEAGTGAWAVAQHADVDVAFQQRVVDLLRPAVAQGQADPTELAYLEDRVAVNRGEPQRYGTQVRCVAGAPTPATPLVDPAGVEALRAGVGLDPLATYYTDLTEGCVAEAAAPP